MFFWKQPLAFFVSRIFTEIKKRMGNLRNGSLGKLLDKIFMG